MGSPAVQVVEMLLGAALDTTEHTPWDENLFEKFKGYIEHQEQRMEESLRTVKYTIDAPSTFALLLGSGRVEKVWVSSYFP